MRTSEKSDTTIWVWAPSGATTMLGLRGPGLINLDILMAKEFRFTEVVKLQFRAEFYNAMNHFNPGTPNTTIGFAGVGAITTGNAGRNIQLSLKLWY